MRKIIGIVSGKGGVGKTTLVINLGLAILEFNQEVILADIDLNTSNLGLHLGSYNFPKTIHDALKGKINISETIYTHSSGLKIIPASISLKYLNTDPSELKKILHSLDSLIILDSPPGLDKEVVNILNASDEILVVTNPELPATIDALKVIRIANELNKKILGIVLNKTKRHKHEIKKEEIEVITEVPVIGSIPEDSAVTEGILFKKPVVKYKPHSPASQAFKKLAANILKKEYKQPRFLKIKQLREKFKYI